MNGDVLSSLQSPRKAFRRTASCPLRPEAEPMLQAVGRGRLRALAAGGLVGSTPQQRQWL